MKKNESLFSKIFYLIYITIKYIKFKGPTVPTVALQKLSFFMNSFVIAENKNKKYWLSLKFYIWLSTHEIKPLYKYCFHLIRRKTIGWFNFIRSEKLSTGQEFVRKNKKAAFLRVLSIFVLAEPDKFCWKLEDRSISESLVR